MNKCPNCGAPMETGVCEYCGTKAPTTFTTHSSTTEIHRKTTQKSEMHIDITQSSNANTKSKGVLLILVIFFGAFGFHNFYVGRTGRGILFFFTVGLFCFGWVYDIFKVCTNQFVDANGQPIGGN